MLRTSLIIIISLTLAGCYTTAELKKNYKFNSKNETGLVAVSSTQLTHEGYITFWKINLNKGKFEKKFDRFSNCIDCQPDETFFNLGKISNPEFKILTLPTGTYAVVAMSSNGRNYSNFCRGTMTFVVEAGKVNMLSIKRANPDLQSLEQLKSKLSKFQGIQAEIIAAQIPAAITFPRAGKNGRTCWNSDLADEPFRIIDWKEFISKGMN